MNQKKRFYKLLGVGLIILLWWFLSSNFGFTGMILSPVSTMSRIYMEMQSNYFWISIFRTFSDIFASFLFGLICAFVASITALRFKNFRYILAPVVTTLRSAPTIAVITVLILILPLDYITTSISFLVIFPLLFENLLASLECAPTSEIQAAKSLGLSFSSCVAHIYIPNAFSLIFANIISAFGLNYKVVIAAEILGRSSIPSIGSNILTAKQSLDFSGSFIWLVISILLAFVFDFITSKVYKVVDSSIG